MPKLDNIEAVIFDMDGLIYDTEQLRFRFYQQAAEEKSFAFPIELYTQLIGLRRQESERLIKDYFTHPVPLDALRNRRNELFDHHVAEHGVPTRPGLAEVFETLQQRQLKSAIASSSFQHTIQRYLLRSPLFHRFDVIVSGDQVKRGKPSPDIFLLAADKLGVAPANCLVLEDSPAGIQAAHAANMRVIWIPDMVTPTPDIKALCTHTHDSLHHVATTLEAT